METKQKAKKIKILSEIRVEADVSAMCWGSQYRMSEDEWAKQLERAIKDFHDFLRDHRSQDLVTLDIVREYKNVCSVCKDTWEPDIIEGVKSCAYCGAEIDEGEPNDNQTIT